MPVTLHQERVRQVFFLAALLTLAVAKFAMVAGLPIDIVPNARHDDAVFMNRAEDLVNGKWLGDYDQYTLMKGPGYPFFLALTHLSGMPVTWTHALFQVVAVVVAGWAALRLTNSRWTGAAAAATVALLPVGTLPDMQRILRDQIYWIQTVISYCLFAVAFLVPAEGRVARLCLCIVAALIFDWAWLTREEGILLLPGLAFLAVAGAVAGWSDCSRRRDWLLLIAVAVLTFCSVNTAFLTANRAVYGSWVGVDFKEYNFTAVLNALQGVEVGPVVPYVPVPHAVREAVAKVSPSFAPLNDALAPDGPLGNWRQPGCKVYRQTCSDIAGGWFMWALRDAAALNGFYETPGTASRRFGQVAAEINSACSDGRLTCHKRWLNYLPRMDSGQIASIPERILKTALVTALMSEIRVTDQLTPLVVLRSGAFDHYWRFLNRPLVDRANAIGRKLTVSGWYYDKSSQAWPHFEVRAHNGNEIAFSLERRDSPDIQEHFSDSKATRNRFALTFYCPDECTIIAGDLRLSLLSRKSIAVSSAGKRLYVDKIKNFKEITIVARLRKALIDAFKFATPCLLIGGLVAVALAAARACITRAASPALLAAIALWIAVAVRIVILGLIDASSFPGASVPYAAPASYLAAIAAILSLADAGSAMRLSKWIPWRPHGDGRVVSIVAERRPSSTSLAGSGPR